MQSIVSPTVIAGAKEGLAGERGQGRLPEETENQFARNYAGQQKIGVYDVRVY